MLISAYILLLFCLEQDAVDIKKKQSFFFNSKLAVLNYRENYFLYIQKLKNFKIVLEIARKLNNGQNEYKIKKKKTQREKIRKKSKK